LLFTDAAGSGVQGRGVLGSTSPCCSAIAAAGVGLAPGRWDFAEACQLLLRRPQLRASVRISLLHPGVPSQKALLLNHLSPKDRSSSRRQVDIASCCPVPASRQHQAPGHCTALHRSLWAPADTATTCCRQSEDRKPQATSQSGWANGTTGKYVRPPGDLNQAKPTAVYRQTNKLPHRKYYGFKLTETSWWPMSEVWGWHRCWDAYEKLPVADTPKCSQEKPQPFRHVKLRATSARATSSTWNAHSERMESPTS